RSVGLTSTTRGARGSRLTVGLLIAGLLRSAEFTRQAQSREHPVGWYRLVPRHMASESLGSCRLRKFVRLLRGGANCLYAHIHFIPRQPLLSPHLSLQEQFAQAESLG